MVYQHSGTTVQFPNGRMARAVYPIAGGAGVHSGALVDLTDDEGTGDKFAYPFVQVDENGEMAAAIVASDTLATGQQPRYANGAYRNAAPAAFNLWDFVVDALAGAAYAPSYKFHGLTWGTSNGNVTAGFPQLVESLHDGATITLWRGASTAVGLTTTLTYTSGSAFTVADTPTNAQSVLGEAHIEGTDVTEAFQAALDAAGNAAAVFGGAKVFVPAGVWLVAGNLSVPDNVWIEGAGRVATTILLKSGVEDEDTDVFRTHDFTTWVANTAATNSNRGAFGFKFSNLTIDGNFRNNETNGRYGLALFGFDYELQDLMIRNCRSSGIYSGDAKSNGNAAVDLGVGPGGVHTYWDRVMVMACGTNSAGTFAAPSVTFNGPHDSLIDGLDIYKRGNSASAGLLLGDGNGSFSDGQDSSAGTQISQLHVWGNCDYGVDINGFTGYVKIADSQFDAPDVGIRVRSNGCSVRDSRFYSVPGASAVSHYAIEMAGGKFFTAEDCHFEDLGAGVVNFTGEAALNAACTIKGKFWYSNSTYDWYPPLVTGTIPDDAHIEIINARGEGERDFVQLPIPKFGGPTLVYWEDHFVTGSLGTTGIGKMGFIGSAAPTMIAGEDGHPGIIRLSTGASNGTTHHVSDRSTAGTGTFLPAEDQIQFKWVGRLNTNDSTTAVRVGLFPDGTDTTPSDGIYFEKAAADTSWHCVTMASSSETDTDSEVDTSTDWVTLELYKGRTGAAPSAVAWKFAINGTLVATHTDDIPTAAVKVVLAQITNSTAADKSVDIDYAAFSLKTSS